MSAAEKIRHIGAELKGHAPFTTVGALLGIAFMLIFNAIGKPEAATLFKIFHPTHVLLSAMVTASIFRIHENKKNILLIIMIGYFGSIGVATLSDCIVPYIGEQLLGLDMPTHADMHVEAKPEPADTNPHAGHDHDVHSDEGGVEAGHVEVAKADDTHAGHDHGSHDDHGLHLGFIEDWYIVNPAAALGILIAFLLPRTKSPHALHVLISTWASSAHILMNTTGSLTAGAIGGIFVILFIAVWLPCCISDIIFPLLFVKSDLELVNSCVCTHHQHHSHEHTHQHTEKCDAEEKSQ
jgi:hypothetical protein